MRGIYSSLQKIEDTLTANPLLDRVTYGTKDDINEMKGEVGSFAQIWITPSTVNDSTLTLGLIVILGSQVKESIGNEQDVLNKLAAVAARLASELQYGDLSLDGYQMTSDMNMTPLYPENTDSDSYGGWECSFNITILNDVM